MKNHVFTELVATVAAALCEGLGPSCFLY